MEVRPGVTTTDSAHLTHRNHPKPRMRTFRFDARHTERPQPETFVTTRPGVYWRAVMAEPSDAPNGLDIVLVPVDGHDVPATATVRELPPAVREVV